MSTQHSRKQWRLAECDGRGGALEEWESRRCEGCGILRGSVE
jgi:hypothetical protein